MTKANCFPTKTVSVAAVVLSLALSSHAQIINLTDNNSFAQVDTGSSAGMFNWLVDGQDQLAQQWFWYRVGSVGPEAPINTISAPTIITPNARTLYTTYNNGAFSVEIDYVLTGQSVGSGQASINETIRIHNFTANPLEFHFFQYSDFDLAGPPNNVALGTDLGGLFNEALQTAGPLNSSTILEETEVTPGANHGEAGAFPFTLNRLNDGLATTLNDNAGPVGPGDVTWALEWDSSIASGGDLIISKQKVLNVAVPEPTACALVGLAAAACIWRRRSR